MPHTIVITSGDGQTGHLIAELLLTDFADKLGDKPLTVLTYDESKTADLAKLGAKIVPMAQRGDKAARSKQLVASFKQYGVDTICLIPPARPNKVAAAKEMIQAAKEAGVQNTLMIGAAAVEYATDEEPILQSFVEIESMVLEAKGDADVPLSHSPCIIRPALYAETLLLLAKRATTEGALRLPIGETHKMAPVALGDVALLAATILVGEGKQGFDDKHRGQLIVQTGPLLAAGNEIVEALEESIGVKLEFEDIEPNKARKQLAADTDLDSSEIDLLMEYYALAREGKLNYISTLAGTAVTGQEPQELTEFFKSYDAEFQRKRRKTGAKK